MARATTNAIAAQAGISPGSLYQFFTDKSAIAEALGRRYADQVAAAHRAAFTDFDAVRASLDETVAHIVEPIAAFERNHPAFLSLFAQPDLPAAMAAPLALIERAFVERVTKILHDRNPTAPLAHLQQAARISIAVFKGVLSAELSGTGSDELAAAPREPIDGAEGELKRCPPHMSSEIELAITGYLVRKGLR